MNSGFIQLERGQAHHQDCNFVLHSANLFQLRQTAAVAPRQIKVTFKFPKPSFKRATAVETSLQERIQNLKTSLQQNSDGDDNMELSLNYLHFMVQTIQCVKLNDFHQEKRPAKMSIVDRKKSLRYQLKRQRTIPESMQPEVASFDQSSESDSSLQSTNFLNLSCNSGSQEADKKMTSNARRLSFRDFRRKDISSMVSEEGRDFIDAIRGYRELPNTDKKRAKTILHKNDTMKSVSDRFSSENSLDPQGFLSDLLVSQNKYFTRDESEKLVLKPVPLIQIDCPSLDSNSLKSPDIVQVANKRNRFTLREDQMQKLSADFKLLKEDLFKSWPLNPTIRSPKTYRDYRSSKVMMTQGTSIRFLPKKVYSYSNNK